MGRWAAHLIDDDRLVVFGIELGQAVELVVSESLRREGEMNQSAPKESGRLANGRERT